MAKNQKIKSSKEKSNYNPIFREEFWKKLNIIPHNALEAVLEESKMPKSWTQAQKSQRRADQARKREQELKQQMQEGAQIIENFAQSIKPNDLNNFQDSLNYLREDLASGKASLADVKKEIQRLEHRYKNVYKPW